jgi:hypothetical protein
MLADVLLADYCARGFGPVIISEDIDEGDRQWKPGRPQVFCYDDFLGRITLGELTLRKNEDARLAAFIQRVRGSVDKRFILTTREYILAEAQSRYERLAAEPFSLYTHVIELSSYTPLVRAQILYNHLFFSHLPTEIRRAMVERGAYRRILGHPRYNPRIIRQVVELPHLQSSGVHDFVENFLSALDSPAEVWGRIYEGLPEAARAVLLALISLPRRVFVEDLEAATVALMRSEPFDSVGFDQALRTLEGTFISIDRPFGTVSSEDGGHYRTVQFHDPSVADYLRGRLGRNQHEAIHLIRHARFFDQLEILWNLLSRSDPISRHSLADAISGCDPVLLHGPNPRLDEWWEEGKEMSKDDEFAAAPLNAARKACLAAAERWRQGQGCKAHVVDLLALIRDVQLLQGHQWQSLESSAFQWIVESLETLQDYQALVDLYQWAPELFGTGRSRLKPWRANFDAFVVEEVAYLMSDEDDSEVISQEGVVLHRLAKAFQSDLSHELRQLQERELGLSLAEAGGDEIEDGYNPWYEPSDLSDDTGQIDVMFEGLAESQ